MANYKFKCESCSFIESQKLSIDEFLLLKSKKTLNNKVCSNCNQLANFTRIFKPTSSKIIKGREEMLSDMQEEVKRTVSEVRAGNAKVIRDIYGEEI